MKSLVIAAGHRAGHRLQEMRECIGSFECHDAFGIADAPAPFHPMIGGWAEDALYYHRARTRHNEQAILIFALEAEMAGKDRRHCASRACTEKPMSTPVSGCRPPASAVICDGGPPPRIRIVPAA